MENNAFLMDFLNNIDILALIIVRLVGFFMLLPVFSGSSVPSMVKIIFVLPLALMIYSNGMVAEITYFDSTMGMVILLVKEFLVGLSMSFAVYSVYMVLFMVGQFMDYAIGFSMVSVFDPITQIQVPITGNLLYMAVILLLAKSGGLHSFIAAISYSFERLPVGNGILIGNSKLAEYMLEILVQYFTLGVQIAMPIVGTIFVVDVSLGLLVKAAPQMNVFAVGIPIKLLIGLCILYFIMPAFGSIYEHLYEQSYKAILNIMFILGGTPAA